MKRRIRYIFILMTACILGINIFQGYWLYNSYTVHNQQFTRTVTDALFLSLQKQQEADAQGLIRTRKPDEHTKVYFKEFRITKPGELDKVTYERVDSLIEVDEKSISNTDDRVDVIEYRRDLPRQMKMRLIPADTLARRISNRIIVNWFDNQPFDLKKMDSSFSAELKLREINAAFKLDTIHHMSLKDEFPKSTSKVDQEYPIQLHPVPVNPIHNLFLQASFKKPYPYILGKMSWLLISSVLLLALTTGCFLYMLSTILRQKKLSEIKNDFINNMTHELKTPLATVSAAVEGMLSFGALQDAQKTHLYLNISKNELQRLSDLVEKVLNIAVEEKKEFVLMPEALKPSELIEEIVSQYQLKTSKPVEFLVDIPQEEPVVKIDRMHIGNTINNLIDNAIKYSYETVTICISSKLKDNAWCLSVKDSGIGIPKLYQKAIFDRFFRVPTGNLHQVKGFGLGLSYVKQVVEKHGGHVEVRSEPSQGSEFVLWFPIEK